MEVALKILPRSFVALPVIVVVVAIATGAARAAAPPAGGTAPATPAHSAPAKPASDDSGRLDGIAAVVNDDVILQSDVEEQLYMFLQRAQAQPDSATIDTLRTQVLNQLIDEKLIVAEAKRQNVTVSDAEVSRQVDQAINDAKARMGSAEAFRQQLAKENLTEEKLRDKYRDDVRRQLVAQRLVQKQIPPRKVPQAEAEAYFKAHPDKFPGVPAELKLSVIQIPVIADSITESKAKTKIDAIRKRIVLGGEKFAKVATETSDDEASARSGGDLGYFARGGLDPDFEEAAYSQKLGVVGPPVRSSFGWHLIEVLDRDTVKTRTQRDSLDAEGKPLLEVHVRHILVKVDIGEADVARAQKLAESLHAQIQQGADFGVIAKRYSQYKGPHTPEGDVGFVSLGTLAPNIRTALEPLKAGELSPVLTNRTGFNIFKVAERKPERPYTLEEIKDELPDAVAQIQFREKYEAYVKGLRSKAQIQIR